MTKKDDMQTEKGRKGSRSERQRYKGGIVERRARFVGGARREHEEGRGG
jgi:hypothetical protein